MCGPGRRARDRWRLEDRRAEAELGEGVDEPDQDQRPGHHAELPGAQHARRRRGIADLKRRCDQLPEQAQPDPAGGALGELLRRRGVDERCVWATVSRRTGFRHALAPAGTLSSQGSSDRRAPDQALRDVR